MYLFSRLDNNVIDNNFIQLYSKHHVLLQSVSIISVAYYIQARDVNKYSRVVSLFSLSSPTR